CLVWWVRPTNVHGRRRISARSTSTGGRPAHATLVMGATACVLGVVMLAPCVRVSPERPYATMRAMRMLCMGALMGALLITGCKRGEMSTASQTTPGAPASAGADGERAVLEAEIARFAPVVITADVSGLPESERKAL